jgi:hypothetical protein
MGESRSNRFGVFQAAVVAAYGGFTACSALPVEPAPVSIFPIDRLTDAVTAGANRRVMAESEPAAIHGELRFVVVPRGQTVSGTVPARQISRQATIAPDRDVHRKKRKAQAMKVSAPVTTVEDVSAELTPLN